MTALARCLLGLVADVLFGRADTDDVYVSRTNGPG